MNTQVQSASENHTPSEFQEAIKALGATSIEENENEPERKKIEEEEIDPELQMEREDLGAIEKEEKPVPEPKAPVAPKVELDPKKYNESLELKRKQFLAEKKWKQEKLVYDQRIKALEEKINGQANPKQKFSEPRSESEIFDDIVNDPENKWLSPKEIKEKVKEELRQELKSEWQKEREQEKASQQQETEIAIFKEKINEHLESNSDTYPLINAMGYEDNVWDLIEQDYQRNLNEYGDEYANDNIMSIEDASKKLENYLAQQFKSRLKSKNIGKSLRSYLSDDGGEPSHSTQSNTPNTLTNDFSRNPSVSDEGPENEHERLKWALKFVK